jgi:ribosomal protein L27
MRSMAKQERRDDGRSGKANKQSRRGEKDRQALRSEARLAGMQERQGESRQAGKLIYAKPGTRVCAAG